MRILDISLLRYHKATRDYKCYLCTYQTRVYQDLSIHLRQQHQVFKNPHPRNDQIDNIEIISEDQRRNQLYSDVCTRNRKQKRSKPPRRRDLALEVDPETKRIIAEKIERANIELAELQESQTEVRGKDIGSVGLNNNSEDEDDPAADISRYSTPVPVITLIFVLLCVESPADEETPVILLQPSIRIIGRKIEVN